MRIERLTVREIEMPLKTPFVTSTGAVRTRRVLLVNLEDADGTPGWAECVAGAVPGYAAETVNTAWETLTGRLAPKAVGREVEDAAGIISVINTEAPSEPMARAAIEMACWDLAARSEHLPLAELLGGSRTEVPAGIALGMAGSPEQTAELSAGAVERGYGRIKLKIKPGADIEVVEAVRQEIGDRVALTVDGNGAYSRADIEHLATLDDFGLQMIEQPLASDDLAGHTDLQKRIKTPVCLDESIVTVANLVEMINLESGRIVNLKPGRVGGITTALTMIDLARGNGIGLWVGGMLETGIGRAHNVALASLDSFEFVGDLGPSDRYWDRDIVTPPWTMAGGNLRVPNTEPGLGVTVDPDRIQSLTTRIQEIRAAH